MKFVAKKYMKKEALLYQKLADNKVNCSLCAHRCKISPAKYGICGVRQNIDGILYAYVYGEAVVVAGLVPGLDVDDLREPVGPRDRRGYRSVSQHLELPVDFVVHTGLHSLVFFEPDCPVGYQERRVLEGGRLQHVFHRARIGVVDNQLGAEEYLGSVDPALRGDCEGAVPEEADGAC